MSGQRNPQLRDGAGAAGAGTPSLRQPDREMPAGPDAQAVLDGTMRETSNNREERS